MKRIHLIALHCLLLTQLGKAAEWIPFSVTPPPSTVDPMTGIVLWQDSEHVKKAPIQLEFFYLPYSAVILGPDQYDWNLVEKRLTAIANRKHQAVIRFWDTYPAKESGVPEFIRNRSDWRGKTANSEGKPTGFPDWGNAAWQTAHLAFFKTFAERYDHDPRLAFLECGFGLWSEYHIYDGPFELGRTFPDRSYQEKFLTWMSENFKETCWMISIDAADSQVGPFGKYQSLKTLPFGVFDDSFLSKEHPKVNALNWKFFGANRWKTQPGGGELSYYTDRDQRLALSKDGPHGESIESASARFHVSFMIGNDQPDYVKMARIGEAGKAMGYGFRLDAAERSGSSVRLTFSNTGVAPIYYDAYPAFAGVRAKVSLKGLLPGKRLSATISSAAMDGEVSIESDRLVPGQKIGFTQ